jgi:multicomponent Na+:H+ antiporter subunit E
VRRIGPSWLTLGRAGLGSGLVVVWVLLWGELSAANVLSGAALAVALLVVFPLDEVVHVDHRVHPLGIVRLVVYFVVELVVSTTSVARDVLIGPSRVRTGIVACPLRVDAEGLITLLANMIALSPGTLPIHVGRDPLVLYLHILRLDHPDAVRQRVSRLEALAVGALGSAEMIAACAVPPPPIPDPPETP